MVRIRYRQYAGLRLGERESGTARLEEAVAAFDACLTVAEKAWPEEWVQDVRSNGVVHTYRLVPAPKVR